MGGARAVGHERWDMRGGTCAVKNAQWEMRGDALDDGHGWRGMRGWHER